MLTVVVAAGAAGAAAVGRGAVTRTGCGCAWTAAGVAVVVAGCGGGTGAQALRPSALATNSPVNCLVISFTLSSKITGEFASPIWSPGSKCFCR